MTRRPKTFPEDLELYYFHIVHNHASTYEMFFGCYICNMGLQIIITYSTGLFNVPFTCMGTSQLPAVNYFWIIHWQRMNNDRCQGKQKDFLPLVTLRT